MTDRLLLRPTEAGDAIGVSRSKTYELIAAGKIPSVMVGGCVRVPVKELEAWIKARVRGGSTEEAA
jgi:prophage regulatory protein